MKLAIFIPIIYVILSQFDSYLAEQAANLGSIGVGPAPIALVQGLVDKAAEAVATVAIFFGITIPTVGRYYADKLAERSKVDARPIEPSGSA